MNGIIRTSNLNKCTRDVGTSGYVTEGVIFDMDTITRKRCSKCGETKPVSDFSPNYTNCKKCIAAYRRERIKKDPSVVAKVKEWIKNHPGKQVEYVHKYLDKSRDLVNERRRELRKDPVRKEKAKAYNKMYGIKNPEKKRASSRAWKLANQGKDRARTKQWQRDNRDRVNTLAHNYRARKAGNGGEITAKEWKWLKEFYNYTCLCCGRCEPEIKLTLDHVVPISKGGKNVISNAQPLCGSCNTSKKDKTIDYRKTRRLI
jgi:5-methylcytosine-specific restriction endonuclease McrA